VSTVELLLPALSSHVRTARLVSVAAGRRAGLHEDQLDELRLAVGEACARAVALNAAHAPAKQVRLVLREDDRALGRLMVEVHDAGPPPGPALERNAVGEGLYDREGVDPEVSLAVLRGLVEQVTVERRADETVVGLSWPLRQGVLTPDGSPGERHASMPL
jgi:anti-sigma regulatory factor (Ser/Thr protein kinase)